MSQNKITEIVKTLSQKLANDEKLSVPSLIVKLNAASESRPQDQMLTTVANVLINIQANNKYFISKAEFRDIYKKMYVHGTKFSSLFKDELGDLPEKLTPTYAKTVSASVSQTNQVADPILVKGFAEIFDNKVSLAYSHTTADKAIHVVFSNLKAWGLQPTNIKVASGSEYFITVQADYDTPRGLTSILVPVEINKGQMKYPTLFMANNGPQDLNYLNIKNYITSNAGSKLVIRANDMTMALTNAAHQSSKSTGLNPLESAVFKIKSAKKSENIGLAASQVIGLEVDKVLKNLDVAPIKMPQTEKFAQELEAPKGQAQFIFGKEKVNLGREVIARILTGFGHKNPQISVATFDNNVVNYAVSLGKIAFVVPVKIAKDKIISPEALICNGEVLSFTSESLNGILAKNAIDYKAAAVASPSYGLKANELIELVQQAMAEDNYAKAEDALNVLKNTGNTSAYVQAFQAYRSGLNKQASVSEPQTKCSFLIKSPSSQHLICGHTNLPLHKVYQDDTGSCRPNYRKNMDENFQPFSPKATR